MPLGRCLVCGKATCFECGSLVDGRILCFNDAAAAATISEPAANGSDKKKRGLGRKMLAGLKLLRATIGNPCFLALNAYCAKRSAEKSPWGRRSA
jgi:hypothetical protein